MSNNSQPVIELNISPQVPEKTGKESGTSTDVGRAGDDGEMPSVTRLLNRKKLEVPSKAAESAPDIAPQNVEAVSIEAVSPAQEAVSVDPSQPNIEMPTGTGDAVAAPAEGDLPVITAPSRRRGAAQPVAGDEPAVSVTGSTGAPPLFSKTLILERLDFKQFQKAVSKHKKSTDMKKLDCLGFFSARFTEMAYFEVSEAGALAGVLGFGNTQLVVHMRELAVTPELLPSIFEAVSQGEIFAGAIESLRAEDQAGFTQLGFSPAAFVGAFPIMYKKGLTGLWLCAGPSVEDIPQKELAALKKFFANFAL